MSDTAAYESLPGYEGDFIRASRQKPRKYDADACGNVQILKSKRWNNVANNDLWRPLSFCDIRPSGPPKPIPQDPPNLTPAQIIAIRNKLLEQLRKWTPEYTADNAIGCGYCTENFLCIDWQKALRCISENELP